MDVSREPYIEARLSRPQKGTSKTLLRAPTCRSRFRNRLAGRQMRVFPCILFAYVHAKRFPAGEAFLYFAGKFPRAVRKCPTVGVGFSVKEKLPENNDHKKEHFSQFPTRATDKLGKPKSNVLEIATADLLKAVSKGKRLPFAMILAQAAGLPAVDAAEVRERRAGLFKSGLESFFYCLKPVATKSSGPDIGGE